MNVHYIPRVLKNADNQASHNARAVALGLIVSPFGDGLPKECRVLIQHEKYTADYRETRVKPFVVYTRHSGTRTYRAAYATLESAAKAAQRIAQALAD